MECRKIQEALSAYVDGETGPEEKIRIKEHVLSCSECSRALSELSAAIGHLRELTELDPPPWLAGKVMAQVRSDAGKKKGLYERFFSQFLLPRPIHALAAILVLVLSVYVFQTMKTSVPMTSSPEEKNKESILDEIRDGEPSGEARKIPAAVTEQPSFFRNRDAAQERPAAEPPPTGEKSSRFQEEIPPGNRAAIERTDDRFRDRGKDAAVEEVARMDAEMETTPAGDRIGRAPGKVPAAQEKAGEPDTFQKTASETSHIHTDESAESPAGLASQKFYKAKARKTDEGAALPEGTVRIALTVKNLEIASIEIEKALDGLGATLLKKEHPEDGKALIQAMVPRINLTSLTEKLGKIGKVDVETAGIESEIIAEESALVTIEAVSPEDDTH